MPNHDLWFANKKQPQKGVLVSFKQEKDYLKVSFSLLVIHKCFSMFLIKDYTHITDIAYKPFYKEAYLFGPSVYVVNSL